MERRKVYLAGPEVFLPDAVEVGAEKKRLCEQYGFEGLYPLDKDVSAAPGDATLDARIYDACIRAMRRADSAIFNLTPFRGISADPGTVFELGLCVGLGKPVFAYTNDARDLIDRVRECGELRQDIGISVWSETNGLIVEDFANADNLMIDCALRAQGRTLHRHAAADALRDMTGFEACLAEAQATFQPVGSVRSGTG